MFNQDYQQNTVRPVYHYPQHFKGFTLLELLVVILLIAILSGAGVAAYQGLQDQARGDVAAFEMTEIRKALLQFRKDSGTRSFPGQGRYDCTDNANGNPTDINPNIDAQLPIAPGLADAVKIAWCQHPANLWMLFEDPLGTGWNVDTKRGWNGPYLQRKEGFLTLTLNTVNLDNIATPVWAVADAFVRNQNDTGVEWSLQETSATLDNAGSPYLLERANVNNPPVYQARLISAGDDGVFEDNNDNACTTPLDANDQALDEVLCLLN